MSVEIKTYAPYTDYEVDDTDPRSSAYYVMKKLLAKGASCCEVKVGDAVNLVFGLPKFSHITYRVGHGGLPYLPDVNFKCFWVEEPITDKTDPSDINYRFNLPNTLDEYLASLSRKNRSNVKRHLRNAESLTFVETDYNSMSIDYLLTLIRIRDPQGSKPDMGEIRSILESARHKTTLFYAIYEGDTHIGYNLGFIHNDNYYDEIFFQTDDYGDKASDIIAKLITLLVGVVSTYNLGLGSFYKKKFMPDNAELKVTIAKDSTYLFDVNLIFKGDYCYVSERKGTAYGVVFCDDKGGQYYDDLNSGLTDLIKKAFPLATYRKMQVPELTFNGNRNESLFNAFHIDTKTGLSYLDGHSSYKSYYAPYNNLTTYFRSRLKQLPDIHKVIDLYKDHFIDDLYLLEVGGSLEKPDYDKVFSVPNHCLKWYDTEDNFVASFKSKRRKEIKELYANRGTVRVLTKDVIAELYDTLYENSFNKFNDTFSADVLFALYDEPNVVTLGHYDNDTLTGIYTLEQLDDTYWAYQGYLALVPNMAKQGLLCCAEYIHNINPDFMLDLTSGVSFNPTNYGTYKKTVSNFENEVYFYTISHNKIKEPYYKVEK